MLTISTSDITKKPSYISRPSEITLIEDAKKHEPRSVVLPYELYMRLKEQIEDELYLWQNAKALSDTERLDDIETAYCVDRS